MEGLLCVNFGVWMGVLVYVLFQLETCVVQTEYKVSRERGMELIKKVRACDK